MPGFGSVWFSSGVIVAAVRFASFDLTAYRAGTRLKIVY